MDAPGWNHSVKCQTYNNHSGCIWQIEWYKELKTKIYSEGIDKIIYALFYDEAKSFQDIRYTIQEKYDLELYEELYYKDRRLCECGKHPKICSHSNINGFPDLTFSFNSSTSVINWYRIQFINWLEHKWAVFGDL